MDLMNKTWMEIHLKGGGLALYIKVTNPLKSKH